MRTGYADFWELYRRNSLPQATKNYVPGIIAAIIVAKNPQQYGLEDMVPDAPVLSDTVTVDYAVDLRLVADVTGASLPEMVALNPSLLHTSTPRDGEFDLHLPVGTSDVYQKRIAKIPEDKRGSWRFHVVHAGESLESIASSLHGRPAEIAAANGLKENAAIDAGDELVIPVANTVAAAHPLHYTMRAGDTLVKVADRFNVSVEDLRRWNHLSSSTIRSQRTLAVSEPVRLAPATHARVKRSHAGAGTRAGASTTTGAGTRGKASAKARRSATTKSAAKSAASAVKSSAKRTSQSATKKKKVAAKKHDTPK
jgi:membrane-bound lytic murein transglycosylase D